MVHTSALLLEAMSIFCHSAIILILNEVEVLTAVFVLCRKKW